MKMEKNYKGGLRKISGDEMKYCTSSEHNPPKHIVLEPGRYEYVCPSCGHKQIFTVPKITC